MRTRYPASGKTGRTKTMTSNRRQFLAASAALAAGAGAVSAAQPTPPEDTSRLGRTPHTKFAPNIGMWWANTMHSPQRRIEEAAPLRYSAVELGPYEGPHIYALAQACQ